YLTVGCLATDGSSNSFTMCTSNDNCSEGQLCVTHYNYSRTSNCETQAYCISATEDSCRCIPGYVCRRKDCPFSPYECVVIENQETRCDAMICKEDEMCAYQFMDVYCVKCPCYGTHNATCEYF
ncbi:unnamed protein product, partial [Ixodes hexagonus]